MLAMTKPRPSSQPPRRTGRKRKAAVISLPPLASVPPELRPQLVRTRLYAAARPLEAQIAMEADGSIVVTQKLRPERPEPGKPSAERVRHIEVMGTMLAIDVFTTDAGEKTELKRLRIVNPLEQLWKAGVLDAGQYGAARVYQRDADLAVVVGPGATVRYEPRMIEGGGKRFLLPIEAASDYLMRLALAQRACGAGARRMLDWIAGEPLGFRDQARAWWPHASEQWARVSFRRLLRDTCDRLEQHYRFAGR